MNDRERQIYEKLTKLNRLIATILKDFPVTRDLSNDDFLKAFAKLYNGKEDYTFESITRIRRYVQNTLGIFPKRFGEGVAVWKEAIKQIEKDQQLSMFQGENKNEG